MISNETIFSFLQDSIDLSHDDLQRTLQANNRGGGGAGGGAQPNGHAAAPHNVDLNPMDFIENNSVGHGSQAQPPAGHPPGATPHPAGGNFELDFDKFDMLGEFPDLDHYTPTTASAMMHVGAGGQGPLLSSTAGTATPPQNKTSQQQQQQQQHQHHRHTINDYSPEWAWPEVSFRLAIDGAMCQIRCGNVFTKSRLLGRGRD